MKARIDGITYPVDNGWAIEDRQDEQFDSGIINIIAKQKPAFPAYRYAELTENKSVLEFRGVNTRAFKAIDTGIKNIKTIYLDIELNNVVDIQKIIDLSYIGSNTNYIEINGSKLQFVSDEALGNELTKTVDDVLQGRQTIVIGFYDGYFKVFIDGVKRDIETNTGFNLVSELIIEQYEIGTGALDDFDFYELRVSSLEYDEETLRKLSNKTLVVDNVMIPSTTDFIYNEFENLTKLKNRGFFNTILGETDMTLLNLTGKTAKKWYQFTADPESEWFDRELDTYNHTVQLVELTAYITTITTPYISYKQPLDPALPLTYPTLKSMTDRLFDITFTELDGVNLGWIYTDELLAELNANEGFSYDMPEGNIFTVLSKIFNEFAGIPRVVEIINGRLVLGFDYKDRETKEIIFDDYDAYGNTNTSKDYGTMGESRGINVANDDLARSYMYTKETLVTARSIGTVFDEEDMIMQLYYKIKKGFRSVRFIEAGSPLNTVDITPFVVSQEEYTTLPTKGFSSGTTTKFKQNCVVYALKDDKIIGWGKTFPRFLIPDYVLWKELIKSAAALAGSSAVPPASFRSVAIIANYDALLPQSLIRVAKEDISKVNRVSVLQTTQGGSLIDVKKAGIQLHSDIQRSANGIINYTKKVNEDVTKMYNVSEYDKASKSLIVYKKTIGYSDNYIGVYMLNENYSKITSNLDISAKVRVYGIPEDGKAIESSRFYEDFIEWNLEGIEGNTSSFSVDGIKSFMKTFGTLETLIKYDIDNVQMVSDEIVDDLGIPHSLVIPVNPMPYRNTIKLNFSFKDPTFAYSRRVVDGILEVSEGVRYTGALGFLDLVSFLYGKKHESTSLLDANNLPIVNASNYTGNDLIIIGDTQNILVNNPLPVYQYVNNDDISINKKASIGTNVATNMKTTNAYFELRDLDLPGVTYFKTEVQVYEVSALGVGASIGTFTFVPNEVLTIPVNNTIKEIAFDIDVVADKASSNQLYAFVVNTSYDQEETTQGTGLKLSKDAGEILIFDYFAHNVFYKRTVEDIGNIIIGDDSMIENMLCGGNLNILGTDLGVYESEDRYGNNEKRFVKGTRIDDFSTDITFTDQSIQLNKAIADGNSWAIGNINTGKLLFAVNPPRAIGEVKQPARVKVSHNYTHFRSGLIRNN